MKTKNRPYHLANPILDAVCSLYRVDRPRITTPQRKRRGGPNLDVARQVACYLLRSAGFKLREIGSIIGYASHCQAGKNIRTTHRIMSVDEKFKKEVEGLVALLKIS